jgi:CRISPR/Cas system-associated exonuclease Cas4 (RecB family)
MKRKILSPTSINTYLRCPRKYYLKYIKGLKEKPSIYLIRGKAVHDTIARFHHLEAQDQMNFERMKTDLLSLFNHYWLKQEDEIRMLGLADQTLDEYYRESAEMLIGWLKRYIKATMNGQTKPETEVKLISETHRVMGVIDAIHNNNGEALLTDYKTSKKDTLTHDIKVQMAIYALIYKDNYGVLPNEIIIDFLKHQTPITFKVSEEFPQYAIKLCKEIHEKTSSQNEQDYPCTCGGWCEKDFL